MELTQSKRISLIRFKIYAVGREETAWELKRKHPEYLMAGERGGMGIAFVLL